jgi:hypothetical protein
MIIDASAIAVVMAGIVLIALVLWYFLGGRR